MVEKAKDLAHHTVLPLMCYLVGSFAWLTMMMKNNLMDNLAADYVRTAVAKGVGFHRAVFKHAFRNSLFPIITLFSSVFPRTLSGAIAIEMIYAIPGMGYLLLMSITSRDWPIVFAIVMLVAILAMIGNLIADILYAVVDPRIKY
jgi:microcin C transport system permease protein